MEHTKLITKALQEVLNSEEIKSKYGWIFENMTPTEKENFAIAIIYNLAEQKADIRQVLANDIYNILKD